MHKLSIKSALDSEINLREKQSYLAEFARNIPKQVEKVLLIPPDISRKHSGAGVLTSLLYNILIKQFAKVDIMPALGTHDPMSVDKLLEMFGEQIPLEKFIVHNWREDTVKIGEIPRWLVSKVSKNKFKKSIPVRINKKLVDGSYDFIISIGQVVPHEVVGMANYSKNILVGVGGFEIISSSHYIGALAGVENVIGNEYTPVRELYDYAEQEILSKIPLAYILTVNSTNISKKSGLTKTLAIFSGRERSIFTEAVKLSQKVNIIKVAKKYDKILVYLDPAEFKTTWLGGKGIYRTRKALEDGGEIILVAPGLEKFGEDTVNDQLISKYGYLGTKQIVDLVAKNKDLRNNLAAAAHLIQASSEGRFKITVACQKLSKKEIEGINFNYLPLKNVHNSYNFEDLEVGSNIVDGEEIYYVNNPATGLWVYEI